jgi:hypothetical protein
LFFDQRGHVDAGVVTDNDVLATRSERVARAHGYGVVDHVAHGFQPAHDTDAVQVSVVQPVLRDDVMVETSEVRGGDQLAIEKSWSALAFEDTARFALVADALAAMIDAAESPTPANSGARGGTTSAAASSSVLSVHDYSFSSIRAQP